MKVVEKNGKSVEEAVEAALQELGVEADRAEVKVLEEPTKGLFGILGGRPAVVRVSVKESPAEQAVEMLRNIVEAMGIEVTYHWRDEDGRILIDLEGKRLGVLIGRRGETLNALQYLLNLGFNKHREDRRKIIIDIEGYRRKREDTLMRLALKLADRAKKRGRSVVLEPMNPHERRIIHTTLRGRDDVYTFSEGEDPYRKIVIAPQK